MLRVAIAGRLAEQCSALRFVGTNRRTPFRALKRLNRQEIATLPKAAVNAPHSKRFAGAQDAQPSHQRLECGGFSTALVGWFMLRKNTTWLRDSLSAPSLPGTARECVNLDLPNLQD